MKMKKILIVDDSHFFIELQKAFLQRTDCIILAARNGVEALEMVQKEKPDLVLLDLYMKEMKGDECCRHIKEDESLAHIPVIMVTSASHLGDRSKAVAAGCDDYLTKPVNKTDLLRKVKKYIDLPVRSQVRAPIYSKATYEHSGKEYLGHVYVISEGGLYIKGSKVVPIGDRLKVKFSITDIAERIALEGQVVWNTDERHSYPMELTPGMGIEFTQVSTEDLKSIKTYINLGNYLV